MKVELKTSKCFKPFDLVITIEKQEELESLLARMNASTASVNKDNNFKCNGSSNIVFRLLVDKFESINKY